MNRIIPGFVLVTVVTSSSCAIFRRKPTPPPVIAAPPTKPPQPVDNPQVPPPPKVEQAENPKVSPPPVATQIPANPPPQPKPVRKPPRRPPPAVKAQTPPAGTQQSQASGNEPAPLVLAPVLSSAQQESFNRAIDQAIQEAESGLASLARKQLNTTQRANADRARSFVAQAQQTRATDLVTAKTLADRAVVLAQSLVAELR